MKAYNKGGRPTKSLVEKRTYRVNLKMNTEEYYTLKERASEAEVSPCDFIRAIMEYLFLADKIDNLLNQIQQ